MRIAENFSYLKFNNFDTLEQSKFSLLNMSTLQTRLTIALDKKFPQGWKAIDVVNALKPKPPTEATVSLWLNGPTQTISPQYLMRLANWLDVRPEWISSGIEPMKAALKGGLTLERIGAALKRANDEDRALILGLVPKYLRNPEEEHVLISVITRLISEADS